MKIVRPAVVNAVVLAVTLFVAPNAAPAAAALKPVNLRCEYRVNPLGIDSPRPRFSWSLELARKDLRNQTQSAYQVLVASSEKILAREEGDLWDSGKATNAELPGVTYGGDVLFSAQLSVVSGKCVFGTVRETPQPGASRPHSQWAYSAGPTGAPPIGSGWTNPLPRLALPW